MVVNNGFLHYEKELITLSNNPDDRSVDEQSGSINNRGGFPMQLARAYVVKQMLTETYTLEEGFMKGTLFPELYRPYK
jgi:hypothetical protein